MSSIDENNPNPRALPPQTESWLFESQPRQTLVVKTGSYSSTGKCSAIRVSVSGLGDDHYKRIPRVTAR